MEFQKSVEQEMFKAGDGSQAAPAQHLTDFLLKQVSKEMPESVISGINTCSFASIVAFVDHSTIDARV
jgi:uncharacterized FAD-dependent dehydrogenase